MILSYNIVCIVPAVVDYEVTDLYPGVIEEFEVFPPSDGRRVSE